MKAKAKTKDVMLELYEAELLVRARQVKEKEQEKVQAVVTKQLTFLEALDTAFQLREGPPVLSGNTLTWKLSPAILAFIPKSSQTYTLEANDYPSFSLSFRVSIDEDKKGLSSIMVTLPYSTGSYSNSGLHFPKERTDKDSLKAMSTYFSRAKDNKSGIPKDHLLFDEAQQVVLAYVKAEVEKLESEMRAIVKALEEKEAELIFQLDEAKDGCR